MKKQILKVIAVTMVFCISLTSCGESAAVGNTNNADSGSASSTASSSANMAVVEAQAAGTRDSTPVVLPTVASGDDVIKGKASIIDISNKSDGYMMVKYTGSKSKIKMQIFFEGESTPYTYDLEPNGEYEAFVFSRGSGKYTVTINENISGTRYAVADSTSFQVKLSDSLSPFLHPNKYVYYTEETNAVAVSQQLAMSASDDMGVIDSIYNHVVGGVSYDYDLAASVSTFYVPDVDATLSTGKGLCFDYAVAMTAMLRMQRIPTQLILGYAGQAYHAWINVYTPETGWINGAIYFDGQTWVRMDPTFASTGGGNPSITQYVGDGKNYNAMFYY